jgi:hypothetical protein
MHITIKTAKKGVKETIKEQDTPQDKERLRIITPLIQENQDKEQHRRATTSHRKAGKQFQRSKS